MVYELNSGYISSLTLRVSAKIEMKELQQNILLVVDSRLSEAIRTEMTSGMENSNSMESNDEMAKK